MRQLMNFTAMDITLRTLTENDLPFVKDIYDYYTLHTTVVYFVHCASIDELKNYIPVGDPVYRSFIIETPEGTPCGFCYFARFKPREAFRISVELTLYLKPEFTGQGYGKQTILRLEEIIRQEGYSNIMALVSGENEASIRLFERCGFECCANIRQVAEKFGKKLDLRMYQKIISDNSYLTP